VKNSPAEPDALLNIRSSRQRRHFRRQPILSNHHPFGERAGQLVDRPVRASDTAVLAELMNR
jgi:hypothetical protein